MQFSFPPSAVAELREWLGVEQRQTRVSVIANYDPQEFIRASS